MRTLILTLLMALPAAADGKIPLRAAMAQCDQKAIVARTRLGDQGAHVTSEEKISDRFRSCVYAKSGQYPPAQKAETGIRLSGSVSLGIVVSD